MEFIFISETRQSFRYFSPIIKHLQEVNARFLIWVNNNNAKAIKRNNFESEFLDSLSERIIFFNFDIEIKDMILSSHDSYFVSLHPPLFELNQILIKKLDKRWIILQHGHDSFSEIYDWDFYNKVKLDNSFTRYFLIYTDFFYDKYSKWLRNSCSKKLSTAYKFYFSKKTIKVPIGLPVCSSEQKTNFRNVKEKKGKLLYLPFPYSEDRKNSPYVEKGSYAWEFIFSGRHIRRKDNSQILQNKGNIIYWFDDLYHLLRGFSTSIFKYEAWKLLFKGISEKKVLIKVREFCDKNNLDLVIKSRKKFNINQFAYKVADQVIEDNETSQCPSLFQKAVQDSDIVLGYASTAVLEVAYLKKPYVNIELPPIFFNNDDNRVELFNYTEGSIFNYKTIVRSFSIEYLINYFSSKKLSEFSVSYEDFASYKKMYLNQGNARPEKNFYGYFSNIEKN